jgi:hypothetical protein
MPGTAAAALFALLLAPGFLVVRGYGRRHGGRLVHDRDLFAVVEAVVASAFWLAFVWLLQSLFGNPVKDWGILPFKTDKLEDNGSKAVLLGLVVVMVPYGIGVAAAVFSDWVRTRPRGSGNKASLPYRLRRLAIRYGFLESPTAWDQAWTRFETRGGTGKVVIRMRDGSLVEGAWGRGARVDLSPLAHQVYLVAGYEAAAGTSPAAAESKDAASTRQLATFGSAGVFIDGADISAIFFQEDHVGQQN